MHFNSLLLFVFDLEDVLLIVLPAGSPHEHFILGRGGFCLADFGEDEGLLLFFSGVVNRIDHLFSVHVLIIY